MANVNLPFPVALAGGALCVLSGYLVGVVTGPTAPDPTVATVSSYDSGNDRLCLTGDSVADDAAAEDGELCGTWRRSAGQTRPSEGDTFRFVTRDHTAEGQDSAVYFYGEVDSDR